MLDPSKLSDTFYTQLFTFLGLLAVNYFQYRRLLAEQKYNTQMTHKVKGEVARTRGVVEGMAAGAAEPPQVNVNVQGTPDVKESP